MTRLGRLFALEGEEVLRSVLRRPTRCAAHFHGNRVTFCSILPTKFGNCSEDCKFCAQSGHFDTGITPHADDGRRRGGRRPARDARDNGASAFGIVNSGRGPTQARMAQDHGSRPGHEGGGRHLPLRHAGHPDRGAGARPQGSRRPPHQSQPGNVEGVLSADRHHAHLAGARRDGAAGPEGRPGDVLRLHLRHGRNHRRPGEPGVQPQGAEPAASCRSTSSSRSPARRWRTRRACGRWRS